MAANYDKLPPSLKEIRKNLFYTLDYSGDYRLNKFMKTGADSYRRLTEFLADEFLDRRRIPVRLPETGCSAFAGCLENGNYVLGHNFDVDRCAYMLVRTSPADGYASLSMVNLEYLGLTLDKFPLTDAAAPNFILAPYLPMDGINEKGLSMGVLSAKGHITCQQTGKIALTTSTAIRVVLDCCATVAEAVETLSHYDMYPSRGSNYHFQLADASGAYAVIEYANGRMHVLDDRYVTNFFLTPGVSEDRCGQDRYDKLKNTMTEKNGVFSDVPDAMRALADVAEDGTRWSAVYNLTERSLHLTPEHDYEGTYFFSLNAPEL